MAQSRNWCFTVNNWTGWDTELIKTWDTKYTIYGEEQGESGTEHLQGFVMFKNPKMLGGVKQLHAKAHWEAAKGNWEQNVEYCSKEGKVTEHGTKPMTQKRKGETEKERWAEAYKMAKTGKLDEIDGDIQLRFYRTLKEIAKDHMVKPSDAEDVTGVWIYGPPGCGKSRKARADYPGAYDKMQNKWWDGYQGEDYVILDDFDSKELGHHLKIWCDRYSFLAETKGGAINIRPKKIIITSNYSIDHFEWDEDMRAALKRRMSIVHMGAKLGGIDFFI